MKFNSTYELLVYLRKENYLGSFNYQEYHKSTELALLDNDGDDVGLLLTEEIHNRLYDRIWDYCSKNMDTEFNFYSYEILIDENNKLRFYLEKHLNAYFSESFRLEEFVNTKEIYDILSKYEGRSIPVEEFEEGYYLRVDDLDLDQEPNQAIKKIFVGEFSGNSDDPTEVENYRKLKEEIFEYLKGCFPYGERNTINIEDGGVRYSYSQFETINADYFDDEEEYEAPDEEVPS